MKAAGFVLNVVRDRSLVTKRRTIHRSHCVWAGRARRSFSIDAAEAARLVSRSHLDGRTVCCTRCFPGVAGYLVDST